MVISSSATDARLSWVFKVQGELVTSIVALYILKHILKLIEIEYILTSESIRSRSINRPRTVDLAR